MSYIAIASFAANTLGSFSAHGAAKDQARAQSALSQKQIDEALLALKKLGPVKEAKMQLAGEEFKEKQEIFGEEKAAAVKGVERVAEKSGLVTSATVTEKQDDLQRRVERKSEGLLGDLYKTISDVTGWFEGQTSGLQSQIKQFKLQKAASDKAASAKFMGIF